MRIFVTGTDTDVGKTVVASLICSKTGFPYWKPIQTGDDSDSKTIKTLSPNTVIFPEVYKLKRPLSPFDAASFEKTSIQKETFEEQILPQDIVIEGAGGAMIPIAPNFLMRDLINLLNASVVIVAKSKLGFLNHIFLTLEALKNQRIPILGIVLNGATEDYLVNTIESFSGEKVLEVIPFEANLQNLMKKPFQRLSFCMNNS